jgi:hypothetical protein
MAGEPKVEVGEALDSADRDAMASVPGQSVMQMLDSIGSAPWFGDLYLCHDPKSRHFATSGEISSRDVRETKFIPPEINISA